MADGLFCDRCPWMGREFEVVVQAMQGLLAEF